MAPTALRLITAALGLALAAAGVARAAPLDDRVPADAVAYVGWAGADPLQAQFDKSNLKGLLDASAIRDFIDKQLPPLLERAGNNPDQRRQIESLRKGLDIAWRHPVAAYIRGVDMTNPREPIPQFGVICDAGDDARTLKDLLDQAILEGRPPENARVLTARDGNIIYLTTGSASTPAELRKDGGLAAAAPYKAALARVKHDAPAVAVYADAVRALAVVDAALDKADAPPEVKAQVSAAIHAAGLKTLSQLAYTAGYTGTEWTEHSFIGINGPRKGITALLGDTPLSEAILNVVPQDASTFVAWKMDLNKVVAEIRKAAGEVDPNAQREFNEGLARAGQAANVDVEKDLLAPLGDEWTFYRARISEAGNTFALVHPLKDGPTFARSIESLERYANANLRNAPVKIERVATGGAQISTFAVLTYSVAWTVKNNTFYVSTLDGIGGAIKQVENKQPSVATSDLYKAARAALPADVKPTAIGYSNPARLYPEMRVLGLSLLPRVRAEGVQVPNEVFPEPDAVRRFLTPGASIAWSDAAGMHTAGRSAFPGADVLSNSRIGPAAPFVAAGVLAAIPALGRSQEMAGRALDLANLRGIAQASAVYAADNRDNMPDSLEQLVALSMVSPRQLASRRAGTVPLDFSADLQRLAKENPARFREQLAAHTDVVYIGAGLKNELDARMVLVYEKPGRHTTDGISVGFHDAHAEFVSWAAVPAVFADTNALLRRAGKPPVDIEALFRSAGIPAPAEVRGLP